MFTDRKQTYGKGKSKELPLLKTSIANLWVDKSGPLSVDGDQPELLVYILSSPANLDKRNAIRETWLSGIASDIQGYFVIGTSGIAPQTRRSLDDEQEDYADLVLLDMQDSYDRLAEKVIAQF